MENNPTGENINQDPTVAPTPMPETPGQAQVPSEGGVSAEAAQAPASAPTEAVLTEQNVGAAGNPGMTPNPGMMPAGASLRPETMQSQKVTKSIKLPGAKKSYKGVIVVIIIVLVLALGAGAAWWFLAGPGKTEGKQETDEISSDEKRPSGDGSSGPISTRPNYGGGSDTEITPEEEERRVREVVEMMRARAVEFLAERGRSDLVLSEISEKSENNGGYVRPDGWGAAVPATKTLMYYPIGDDIYVEGAYELGMAILEENGFSYVTAIGHPSALYVDENGVFCNVSAPDALLGISCVYKTWVDESQKETVNQMAAGYLAGTGSEIGRISLDMSHLENSSVASYQRIWVDIPGAAADFYRVSPEAEWKFFRAGQDGAACDEYNTDELKNAYAGVTCHVWNGSRDEYYTVEAAN